MELDPNARLFSGEDDSPEQTDEQKALAYVFGLNPNRVSALKELWYENLMKRVDEMKLPNAAAKMEVVFKLTAGALLDMFGDALPPEISPDVMSDFDVFMGVALTNKKFNVNLFGEQQKALESIDPDKFKDTEEYARAVSDAEDA